ncbi:MAG: 50S ribosomal protein L23 [Candidatus Zixiibacteriota bacterium]|nr:MAG: 50S ribosomal protein L23 [candidate division Zixibacteria bacterium]HHI03445.1 50S ribosomal protein L23 [candidate division Zixibacteria bacterium]
MKNIRDVIELHLVTEKSTRLKEIDNYYIFRVNRKANKLDIKKAVEKAFGVKVDTVRTMTMPGKPKRLGRFEGRTPAWKKAIIKLKEGEHIADFDNV